MNSQVQSAITIPGTVTLEKVRALRPMIEAKAAEMEDRGILDEGVVEALIEAGVFGMMVPRCLGGAEAHPDTVIDVLSELAYAHGATGWVSLTTSVATSLAGAYLSDEAVEEIFRRSPRYVVAGTGQAGGKAELRDGMWQLTDARYSFGSGTLQAGWFHGGYMVERDGVPVLDAEGKPSRIVVYVPVEQGDHYGNWDVMGLRATASVDFGINAQELDPGFAHAFPDPAPLRGGPLFRLKPTTLGSLVHGAFPLGVAQRALDELAMVAGSKKRAGRGTLAEQPTFRRDFAQASAALSAARSGLRDSFARAYEAAEVGEVSLELRARARLAASHATTVGVQVTHTAYLLATTDGLRNGGVLQRCFRDMHAGSQHMMIGEQTYIDAGSVVLGVNDPLLYI
jgi:alkylation response protein AidB-like acyl-CoA dehydrogenase